MKREGATGKEDRQVPRYSANLYYLDLSTRWKTYAIVARRNMETK